MLRDDLFLLDVQRNDCSDLLLQNVKSLSANYENHLLASPLLFTDNVVSNLLEKCLFQPKMLSNIT